MPDALTAATFSPFAGGVFVAHFGADGTYPLVLVEVVERASLGMPETLRAPFSLFFTGQGPHYLLQGTYRLSHDRLGDLDVFIVPVGRTDDGFRYQAVFN
ncbi:MAG: hypothetical protein KGO02_07400 [Alphaproteobacteria bacterium]|nr:hypothetical protein [Alphaproteobacteria bacterium]